MLDNKYYYGELLLGSFMTSAAYKDTSHVANVSILHQDQAGRIREMMSTAQRHDKLV